MAMPLSSAELPKVIGGLLFGAAFLVFAAIVFKRGASGSTGTRRRDEDQQDLSSPDGLLGKVLSHCDLHDLFADPPPRGECPVCFSVLPLEPQHSQYMECCGKVICRGCMHEQERVLQTINPPCSFCRTERPFDDAGIMERLKDRAEKGDARAALMLGGCYNEGDFGLPTNKQHTLELWKRAADLGLADACYFLAYYFTPPCITLTPQGTARKPNPGIEWLAKAAKGGNVYARHQLGYLEYEHGSKDLAARHFQISAASGYKRSADKLIVCFQEGIIRKAELEDSLRARHAAWLEMQSEQRDHFLAFWEKYGDGGMTAWLYCSKNTKRS